MSRKKQRRFAELEHLPNALDSSMLSAGGNWVRNLFKNDSPVVLELGCGKGEYTLALARVYRDTNVIGVDRKGDRIWKGAKRALEEPLSNVAFLRARIEHLGDYFDSGQVQEIWMPYPDPLPKRRQAKHRVLSLPFLETYRRILVKGGIVHVKTDDAGLIEYVIETLSEYGRAIVKRVSHDLYAEEPDDELLRIETTYERRHLDVGRTIKYISFGFS
ncbi:MAG TPA: tRNA (guanosine(46)-N7)-methyltransferase TrmB [Acidobacteriota bacterium]|nr:tRNA (guanosine(46)-N7)-methyltransferase TrmB [Acidobacteriota bacterium]